MKKLSGKDKCLISFISVVTVICLIPLVGMIFAPTNSTTENKPLARFPSLVEDEKVNLNYLEQLGSYFCDHFALRQQLVSIDSSIRSELFGVSNVDSVVVGKDGWLFYADTISDFCGTSPMSERNLFNIANNLAITRNYVQSRGARFIFTVAPNKNTLYPQYMPYTMVPSERAAHNAVRLARLLADTGVNYVDLFALFDSHDEILYLERDSHWNNTGALLAANELLSAAGREDDLYSDLTPTVNDSYIGDLNRMIYPTNPKPETNSEYALEGYKFTNGARAADDPVIVTSGSDAEDVLLMYRDSFGNTLLPFMAKAYSSACFVRTVPCDLSLYMEQYQPDTVVFEKVERSIDELASMPPLLETENIDLPVAESAASSSQISVCEPQENIMFWRIDGQIEAGLADQQSKIFLKVTFDDGTSITREAFTVTNDGGDFGFRMYLAKDAVIGQGAVIEAIVLINGQYTSVACIPIIWENIPAAFQ